MMNQDNDLLKQLQNLPSEAQAPDRWAEIQQSIESDALSKNKAGRKPHSRWSMAIAACAVFIAALSPWYFEQDKSSVDVVNPVAKTGEGASEQQEVPKAYQLTIESLQQANAAYYAKLGHMVYESDSMVSPKTLASLESLRQAQQQYRHALAEKPQSGRLQQRLFWLYQKERQLLRQLVV